MKHRAPLAFAFLAAPAVVCIATLFFPPKRGQSNSIQHGRSVYISEGCIHCHSQFVRPGMDENAGLGAASVPEFATAGSPVLIGNRRQGPDLANVGLRRTREWHRMHLINPRLLVPDSLMPSYFHLFATGKSARGDALVDYLDSLGRETAPGAPDETKATWIKALP